MTTEAATPPADIQAIPRDIGSTNGLGSGSAQTAGVKSTFCEKHIYRMDPFHTTECYAAFKCLNCPASGVIDRDIFYEGMLIK